MIMGGVERAVEWLRPLVDSKAWDFCVVWKLGDDPSRFFEWKGCCCIGGSLGSKCSTNDVKQERGEENEFVSFCRDFHFKHPVCTESCEALAQYPSFMPLYSGFHGEAVMSNQALWLSQANSSDPNSQFESVGTQVLVPVLGGLIELFAAKHMERDQKMIEWIMTQCNAPVEQEAVSYLNITFNEQYLDALLENKLQNLPSFTQLLSFIPHTQILPLLTQPHTNPSFEGSSSGFNPSNDHLSFNSHSGLPSKNGQKESICKFSATRKSKYKENSGLMPNSNKKVQKPMLGSQRDDFHSKNLETERNRRTRIKEGLYTLRALVPKISKMDRAAILGDAIEYITELQTEVKKLQDELEEIEEEEYKKNTTEAKTSKLEASYDGSRNQPLAKNNYGFSGLAENKTEVQLEINQIGKREFLIKFLSKHKQGGFRKLMESLNSLGFQVVDANITTFHEKVLNILKIEAIKKEIQLKRLRDLLIELTL